MRRVSGLLLIGIGVLHTLFGLAMLGHVWPEIARDGIFNAAGPSHPRVTLLLWFLMTGFALIPLGHLCFWVEKRLNRPVPAFVGWELLVISVIGIVLDPDSGFWLVWATSLYILFLARRSKASSQEVTQ